MTKLLERAIEKLKQLPNEEQNRFATIVLDDLMWQETFVRTKKKLAEIGEDVLKEIKSGKFKKLDI